MRTRLQLFVLCGVVLAAFLPCCFAGFALVDDKTMVDAVRQMNLAAFASELVPRSLLYYRPVIGITFLIDKYLLGQSPPLMHLQNVLLHCVNAVLVFVLARRLLPAEERQRSWLPMAAALVFALHPINTESVCWISGRTDILSLIFLLSSTIMLLRFRESGRRLELCLAALSFLLALFAKETSIAFAAAFPLILCARKDLSQPAAGMMGLRRRWLPFLLALLTVAAGIVLLRLLASLSSGTLGMTLKFFFTDWTHTALVFLRAFGFYLKKLLIPYPLNFAIVDVDPLYELLGMPLALAALYIASRRTVLSALFTTGLLLIAPSFLLAFNQIAWTPYAERYVYMTSAFVLIASLFYLRTNLVLPNRQTGLVVIGVVVVAAAGTCYQRSLIWQSNLALCRDTVEKSPLSKEMRILYGSELVKAGDFRNAILQTQAANAMTGLGYDDRPDLNVCGILRQNGERDKAIKVAESALEKSKARSAHAHEELIELWELKRRQASPGDQAAINRKLFAYRLALFKLNNDSSQLYHLGELCRLLGERERALNYYRHACNNLSEDAQERKLAEKALIRMTQS